ncbi:MAG TPA: class I SAM-dependent methyltransferase, partial [Dehalococcoidia bacterium]
VAVERLRGHAEQPDPEDRFTALVYERLGPDDLVLDIGCGDGNWLRLVVAPRAARTIGLDYGIARLEQARDAQRAMPIRGLTYAWADARHLPFASSTFSAIINRRGPLTASDAYMREGCRVLRTGGLIFEIGIGEQNAREVYEVFRRGQMFGEPERGPRVERLQTFLREHGCTPLLAESLTTRVRFAGRDGLVFVLETTPMIEDFNRERDASRVDEVVRRHSTEGTVILTMHRTIVIAQKD